MEQQIANLEKTTWSTIVRIKTIEICYKLIF